MRRLKHWRPRFSRKGQKPPYKNTVWREEYEHALILSDLADLTHARVDLYVTVKSLMDHKPGRYNARELRGALDRLATRGLIHFKRGRWDPFRWGGSVCLKALDPSRRLAA